MIQVFCNKRGSGKTKKLIELANSQLSVAKGDSVYIDDDISYITQINSKIRFIATKDFNIRDSSEFYGMLSGIISCNYDIENIYIDGVINIEVNKINEAEYYFRKIYELSKSFNVNIYVNVNYEYREIPDFIREYVA